MGWSPRLLRQVGWPWVSHSRGWGSEPGIPPDLLDRLFVPFDRLRADAVREGGADLGLASLEGRPR